MSTNGELNGAVLARLIASNPNLTHDINRLIVQLPEKDRDDFYKQLISKPVDGNLPTTENTRVSKNGLTILSTGEILNTKWPDPVWAVPGLLSAGLCILAGAPKQGKSWLSLQMGKAISSGGEFLGQTVEKGSVLIFALEDTPQRLQNRMMKMGWSKNLEVDFVTIPRPGEQAWTMMNGGGEKLVQLIKQKGYRLVVIDTLSRAIPGDQMDVQAMTNALTPIQEIAHQTNSAILIVDHHRKAGAMNQDAIADILGSVGKGAMADTIWSLYRESGKKDAKLAIIGREVEAQTLQLEFDTSSFHWTNLGVTTNLAITDRRQEVLDAVSHLGIASPKEIEEATGQQASHLHGRLQDLVSVGLLKREKRGKNVFYEPADPPVIDVITCNYEVCEEE